MTTSPSTHLRLDGVSHSFGPHRVLTNVSVTVRAAERIGLIGENGSGKSTLLRIAGGLIVPDAGTVTVHAPGVVAAGTGLLHQQPPFSASATIAQALDSAVAHVRRAAAAVDIHAQDLARDAGDPRAVERYSSALEEAERLDAWSIETRIGTMLSGLGLSRLDLRRLTGELSGGQRARLSLAWVLLNSPQLLLLDEPTHHAVRRSHQVGHAGAAPRTEARAAAKFYADRNAKAVSRRVNDARARLEELERSQIRKPPAELSFAGLDAAAPRRRRHVTGEVINASGVGLDRRLSPVSLSIAAGDTMLISGANGSGKSTLLGLLAGHLHPTSGDVYAAPGVSIGLLTQEVNLPDPARRGASRTAHQAYIDLAGAAVPLSTFGLLAPKDQQQRVTDLSLGQQRRLELAVLLADPPDVLLLDEPTNHLSLALVSALEEAIDHDDGTVVIATHDRWLRTRWNGPVIHLESVGDDPAAHHGHRR